MVKINQIILGIGALFSMASFTGRTSTCNCTFMIQMGHSVPDQMTLSRYQILGDQLGKSEMKRFANDADLRPGMPITQPLQTWFIEHAPCGGKKFCVELIRFDPDTIPGLKGNTRLTIRMKRP